MVPVTPATLLALGVAVLVVSILVAFFIAIEYRDRRAMQALAAEERRRQILLAAARQARAWERHGYR